jgi:putative peptidoglycan lipid II flippase
MCHVDRPRPTPLFGQQNHARRHVKMANEISYVLEEDQPTVALARNVATVGSATLVSRGLGFARDISVAAVFGAGIYADAFFIAFQIANLVRRLLAEGGLNAAIIPLYLRTRDEDGDEAALALAGRLIGTLATVLIALALVLALVMPYAVLLLAPGFALGGPRITIAVELARLMLPYLVFAGPIAVLMGVLNAHHRFVSPGLAIIVFNLTLIAALVIVFRLHTGDTISSARILATAVAFAGLSQLIFLTISTWLAKKRVTPLSISFRSQMRQFSAVAIFGLLANGLPQIAILGGVMVASTSHGAISWIYYANRLIELPLGLVGVGIGTVLVPALAHAVRRNDRQKLIDAESRGLEFALGLALPSAIALYVLAEPLVRVLFERGSFHALDTKATTAALAALALGLPGHVLVKTFSPVFFARENTRTPMLAAVTGFAVALIGSLALAPSLGYVGIALAIALSGWVSAALLAVLISRHYGFGIDTVGRRRLPRIIIAALLMGFVVECNYRVLIPWLGTTTPALLRAAALVGIVLFGLAAYGLLLSLFRVLPPRVWMRAIG